MSMPINVRPPLEEVLTIGAKTLDKFKGTLDVLGQNSDSTNQPYIQEANKLVRGLSGVFNKAIQIVSEPTESVRGPGLK